MPDATLARAHQRAATDRGGTKRGVPRARHGLGRPLRLVLTGSEVHDSRTAEMMLDGRRGRCVIADPST